ncbi:hypothetical protein P154DRAFT_66612 [Amniculicola lignicola CBS 123094]|uniref:LPXTG-domain-containing protein n=1 Tax=Amniculicola lignicola CBS 123094 TaxID=1392246 RepID=A0A6A5WQY9_9PLEO|nr:hypothetical protein P154DRAFT_66612 [Amniculicola lignicola CBS 123094]
MAKSTIIHAVLAFLIVSGITSALEVAPNSPCAGKCLDDPAKGDPADVRDSATFNFNLVCYDSEFTGPNSTDVGRKLVDCQNCLLTSGHDDTGTGERDMGWYLFNNKGIIDWCLFGRFAEEQNENKTETFAYQACNSDCNAIYASADYRAKADATGYYFCDHDGNFTADAEKCMNCLYDSKSNLTVIANVLATVGQMCINKPGKTWPQFNQTSVYMPTRLQLNALASPSSTVSTSSSSSSSSSSTSSTSTNTPASDPSSSLSAGVIAGIVLGALIVIIAILGAILFFLRRLKKQKKATGAWGKNENGPAQAGSHEMYNPVGGQGKERYPYQGETAYSDRGSYGRQTPVETSGLMQPVELADNRSVQELPASRV